MSGIYLDNVDELKELKSISTAFLCTVLSNAANMKLGKVPLLPPFENVVSLQLGITFHNIRIKRNSQDVELVIVPKSPHPQLK